ncbi:MAG: ABC transporter ATP-binding protein, partial [Armatimonadota bacterium]|nr:ABC transporter ATP-binding protein [Armatimonadota bacterium]
METGFVEIRNLHKHFGEVRAVDGVDLSIKEGELLVLLGPSGCGKTTLMRMIAGLEVPTAGQILIGGEEVDEDVPPRARGVAMVFQSYALYPHKTAYDNIAFPLQAAGMAPAAIRGRVQGAAKRFSIGHLLGRALQDSHLVAALQVDHQLRVGRQVAPLARGRVGGEVHGIVQPQPPHRRRVGPPVRASGAHPVVAR